MGFCENLKALRKAKGLSQYQLAKRLGVRRQSIVDWEKPDGKRPSFWNLVCLVTALETSWNKLMAGEVEAVKEENPNWKRCEGLVAGLRVLANAVDTLNAETFDKAGKEGANELHK